MPGSWILLCIEMQSMFAEDTPWHVPWMSGTSSAVIEVFARHPFSLCRQQCGRRDVVPELARFDPPARTFDKMTYSPWTGRRLHRILQSEAVGTLTITGGETDVCVACV
jgi:hypothetical protein